MASSPGPPPTPDDDWKRLWDAEKNTGYLTRACRKSVEINGYHICTTKVDFLIHHNDGSKELVEVKGFETEAYRLTKRLIEAVFLHDNPEYFYTVVR